MTAETRILEAAAELITHSTDADVSTRAICRAAGVTAPTLYHHFGDKETLIRAVVDFGWTRFLTTKSDVAAVVHEQVADDIRAGWDNHLEFARQHPNFYRLMWSPGVAPSSLALQEGHQMLFERLTLGASRGQLRISAAKAAQTVMAACVGAALATITQPERYADPAFATQLREAVIASVTVAEPHAGGRRPPHTAEAPTLASVAATLAGKLDCEPSPLSPAERQLMQQWLTTLADTGSAS
jgi:AcrR family transcriptional regulator